MTEGAASAVTSLLAVLAALAFVLALAWLAIRGLKRMQERGAGGDDAGAIRFVRTLALGPRERVTLIEVGNERLLLGVTAGGITLLRRWDATTGNPVAPTPTQEELR